MSGFFVVTTFYFNYAPIPMNECSPRSAACSVECALSENEATCYNGAQPEAGPLPIIAELSSVLP